MSNLIRNISGVIIILTSALAVAQEANPHLGRDSLQDVIAAMTAEEKINTVLGTGFSLSAGDIWEGADGESRDRVPGAAGNSYPVPRLGIPSIVLADGPAGLRIQPEREGDANTYYATAFPIATLLASSWNVDLLEEVGQAIGEEVKEYGVDILLGPALNIHRIPLGGRNFEYYSEDPLVAGKMAGAMVRGVQSNGVGTSLKHFVANNHEWNRYVLNVKVDQRALREIYLKGFEIAVEESQPWTIMTSYNLVNGVYTSERKDLLTDTLRGQWGFEGFVMTDWFGGRDAVAQIEVGNDMLMPGTAEQQATLREALESGELNESALDSSIEKILKTIMETPTFKGYQYSNRPDLVGNARIARVAATEGMVLLQNNDSTLPIQSELKLALFGNSSYDIITGGTGSGDVNEAYSISMLQGLNEAGYTALPQLASAYTDYIDEIKSLRPPPQPFFLPPPIPEREVSNNEIAQMAEDANLAIITIGRNSGEVADRTAENDFYLSAAEQRLLTEVSKAFHAKNKKVLVVLNIGGSVETASWREQVDAILLAWQPGQEAGYAIADVLSGKVTPSGKLASTFSLRLEDFPQTANFPGVVLKAADPDAEFSIMSSDEAAEIDYSDSIWLGYRYFSTNKVKTAYPFGYGLSYTSFSYSDVELNSNDFGNKIIATVTIKNTGSVVGKEVVQFYLSAPAGSLEKPSEELRGFVKTRELQPGETQTLHFDITKNDLVSFDPELEMWRADAGEYRVKIAASSQDIRSEKNFTLKNGFNLPL